MGYTGQQFLVCDNSTTPNFDAWGSAISTQIAAMGWAKTSDTGQVSWGSNPAPPSSGSYLYEIWHPTDALQTGATQYFFKMEYGSGTNPTLRVSLGTGTNGSGTLTGVLSSVWANGPGNQGSTTFECDFSGDVNRLGIILWRNLANGAQVIAIERTKDVNGNDNSDGVTLVMADTSNSASNGGQNTIVFGVGAAPASANGRTLLSMSDNTAVSALFNNSVPVCPVFPSYGKYGNPMTVLSTIKSADLTEGAIFTTSLYGTTRTYLGTGNTGLTNPGNTKLCLRYD